MERMHAQQIVRATHARILDDFRHLRFVRVHPCPSPDELICVMVVRNEQLRLPDTLRHYRELGIQRFAVIDNGSTDETLSFLLTQQDIDVFSMEVPFHRSVGGVAWVSALIHKHYGTGRWVVWTDADEQLLYDGCREHKLPDLCQLLQKRNQLSLPVMMLDMYSDTAIGLTDLRPGQRLRDACPYFDGTGYVREVRPVDPYREQFKVTWAGGPMERVFRVDPGWLAKVSLMYWDRETWYWNPHVAFPFERNIGKLTGIHLHFKFLSDFSANVIREVHRNQHADNARKYHQFNDVLLNHGSPSLMYEGSVRLNELYCQLSCPWLTSIDW